MGVCGDNVPVGHPIDLDPDSEVAGVRWLRWIGFCLRCVARGLRNADIERVILSGGQQIQDLCTSIVLTVVERLYN